MLGRHRKALAQLGRLFKSGTVKKTYWAVVEGSPDADAGTIEPPLGRLDVTRGWWMKHDPAGQPAVTKWKVLGAVPPPPPGGGRSTCRRQVGWGRAASPHHPHPAAPSLAARATAGDPPPAGEGKTITWLALEPCTGRTHRAARALRRNRLADNAFMKISVGGGLAVADYFNMFNTVQESNADEDLGSGGAMILPI